MLKEMILPGSKTDAQDKRAACTQNSELIGKCTQISAAIGYLFAALVDPDLFQA